MKNTTSWFFTRVILPLTPSIVGIFIRYIHTGVFSVFLFNPMELSFSIAMLCLLVLFSIQKIEDREIRNILSVIYIILLIFFIGIFALSNFLDVHIDQLYKTSSLHVDYGFSKIKTPKPTSTFLDIENYEIMFERLRRSVLVFTCVIILVTIVIKNIFKLKEEEV